MNIREIAVQFNYTESEIPPRCRKARDVLHEDGLMTVEIREVDPEEAPVVIVFRQYDYDRETLKETAEYRWFEGQLWTHKRFFSSDVHGDHGDTPKQIRRESQWQASWNSTRATRERMFREWAASFISIEGKVWHPIEEPRYFVDDSSYNGSFVYVHHEFKVQSSRERYFSLLQYDEAKAMADRENAQRGHEMDVAPRQQFEVLNPDVIQVNKAEKVSITVFAMKDVNHANDDRKADYRLVDVVMKVTPDAIEAREHLGMAKSEVHRVYGFYPNIVFDEHSLAGMEIMGMRKKIEALVRERTTLIGTPADSDLGSGFTI